MAERICTKCHEVKSTTEFHRAKKGKHGHVSVCKECRSKRKRHYETEYWRQPENKARKKKNARRHYLNCREKILDYNKKKNLQRKYGISIENYNKMLEEQHGCCKICGNPPGAKRLHVDHDHKLGRVRSLLCCQCNLMLGCAKDEPIRLRLAALYLEEHGIE